MELVHITSGPAMLCVVSTIPAYDQVPIGTVIMDTETGSVLADLNEEGTKAIVAHGGQGAWEESCHT